MTISRYKWKGGTLLVRKYWITETHRIPRSNHVNRASATQKNSQTNKLNFGTFQEIHFSNSVTFTRFPSPLSHYSTSPSLQACNTCPYSDAVIEPEGRCVESGPAIQLLRASKRRSEFFRGLFAKFIGNPAEEEL